MLGVEIAEQAADEAEKEQARELPKEVEEELIPNTPRVSYYPRAAQADSYFGGEDSRQTTHHRAAYSRSACSKSCSRPFTATFT